MPSSEAMCVICRKEPRHIESLGGVMCIDCELRFMQREPGANIVAWAAGRAHDFGDAERDALRLQLAQRTAELTNAMGEVERLKGDDKLAIGQVWCDTAGDEFRIDARKILYRCTAVDDADAGAWVRVMPPGWVQVDTGSTPRPVPVDVAEPTVKNVLRALDAEASQQSAPSDPLPVLGLVDDTDPEVKAESMRRLAAMDKPERFYVRYREAYQYAPALPPTGHVRWLSTKDGWTERLGDALQAKHQISGSYPCSQIDPLADSEGRVTVEALKALDGEGK